MHTSDDINVYASYSHGYKAGGFNLDQEAVGSRDANGLHRSESFRSGTSDSLELGLKGRFRDQRLTVNGALFHATFDDFQLNPLRDLAL